MVAERFAVEASHIMMFARAVGDPNEIYYDASYAAESEVGSIIAPPTFAQASAQFDPDYVLRPKIGQRWFGSGKEPTGAAPKAPRDQDPAGDDATGDGKGSGSAAGGLHAEQHFTYHRHPRPGDVLSATVKPGESWTKESKRGGKLTFSETITEYHDESGELVITARGVGVRTEKVIEQ